MPRKLATCVMAEGISVDQITGRVSAFQMYDAIRSKTVPALLPKMMVLLVYECERPETFAERVTLTAPNGEVIAESRTRLTTSDRFHNSIHALWAIKLPEFGRFTLTVSHADKPTDAEWATVAQRRLDLIDEPHPLWPENQPRTPAGSGSLTR